MTRLLKLGAITASCGFILGWSAPLAYGSGAPTPAVPVPAGPSTEYPAPTSEFGLAVSPTRLVLGPGQTPEPIQVVNRGSSRMAVSVQKRNFTTAEDGSLNFQDDAPYAASDWVTVMPTEFVLQPGTAQKIDVAVTVALNPDPGDHQVAIVLLVPAGESQANVKINRGIATPVLITVPGPTDSSATMAALDAPGFTMGDPIAITAKVRSTGTVHRDFRGPTTLGISASGNPAAFPDFTVLRGATREVSTEWDPPLLCVCDVTVSFANADGAVQAATVRVIVFPFHLLAIVVGSLLAIWLIVRLVRRRYRTTVANAAARLNRPTRSEGA